MADCTCVTADGLDKEAVDLYGEEAVNNFSYLVAEVAQHFVGLGFVLKRIRTLDTMAIIEAELPGQRHVTVHFHPDRKLTYCHSFAHIDRDPEQKTDRFHTNTVALVLHRVFGFILRFEGKPPESEWDEEY